MWRVEQRVFPGDEEERLIQALSETSVPFDILSADSIRSSLSMISSQDVVRGSCWFVLEATRLPCWRDEVWGTSTDFSYSHYSEFYRDVLLNFPYRAASFHELCWARERILPERVESVFVRPDDGFKSIEGQLVHFNAFDEWVTRCELLQVRGSAPLIIASTKEIEAEWRCLVVDGDVIASSQYRPSYSEGSPADVRRFVSDLDVSLARPCRAYAIDVARTPSGLRVVEVGSICCVAFYESDATEIVRQLTAI